jgi:hypothetical protein
MIVDCGTLYSYRLGMGRAVCILRDVADETPYDYIFSTLFIALETSWRSSASSITIPLMCVCIAFLRIAEEVQARNEYLEVQE